MVINDLAILYDSLISSSTSNYYYIVGFTNAPQTTANKEQLIFHGRVTVVRAAFRTAINYMWYINLL